MRHYIDLVKLLINFQKKTLNTAAIREEIISLNDSTLSLRRYTPVKKTKKAELSAVFLPHGLNHHGFNDPRIMHLARVICACGYTVYTPHLSSIIRYDINFALASHELQSSLNYIFTEKPQAKIKIICFSLIASLTLFVTSLPNIGSRIQSIFMLSGYYDPDAFIDYVLFHPKASQFAKFILLKNLFNYQYDIDTRLEEQLIQIIEQLQDTHNEFDYEHSLSTFPIETKEIIDTVMQVKSIDEIGQIFNKGIEELKNACRLHIEFKQTKPQISIVHSRDDNIIPASEAYKLEAAFKEQTKVKTLVTPLFDHADIKLSMGTIIEFIKLCRMINFI